MKSLDEIIKALSIPAVNGYHYIDSNDAIDALKYLEMYKELANDSALFAKWKENSPLTWNELKQMERKPVWIEADNGQEQFKHWFIIDEFTESDIPGIQIMWCLNAGFRFREQDLDKTWKAYRKERE